MVTDHPSTSLRLQWHWAPIIVCLSAMLLAGCGSTDLLVKGPYMRGVDLYQAGDSQAAITEYQSALADKPEDHRVHYNLALCFHDLFLQAKEANDLDKAAIFLERARESYENSGKFTELKAKSQVAEAKLVWDSGEKEKAIEMLDGIKGDDGTGEAMPIWTRGTMLSSNNQHDEAALAFEQSLLVDEGYLPAITALAELRIFQGNLVEAQVLVDRGLKKSKHDLTLLTMNARIAHIHATNAPTNEKWEDCLIRWQLAEAIVPTDWEVLHGIAHAAEALGKNRLAVRYYWYCEDNMSDFSLNHRGIDDAAAFRQDIKNRLSRLYPLLAREE